MKRVRVLRIITRLNIGGPAIHTVLLTAQIDQSIFQTKLVAGEIQKHEYDMGYFAKKYNVDPFYITGLKRDISFSRDIFSIFKLYRIMRTYKPDIIHTHTAKAGFVGRIAGFLAGIKIIIHTFHGNIFSGYFNKLKSSFFIKLEKVLSLISTKIIALSKQQKRELIDLKIAKCNKISIIQLGFDFNNILPSSSDKNKFKSRYNIPENSKLIGIIGRLTHIKNHDLFIQIAERLLDKYDNIYFPIIGDGELKDELQESINNRGLHKYVFITGFIKDLKPVYADLDAVVLTSLNEGTPVAIIESMAALKLVCCTDVGGISDFIENGVDGFYFDKYIPDPFVDFLSNWIENPSSYKDIPTKASKKAIETFNESRLIKDIENLYLECLKHQ